jgi:hypothetical protein
MQNAKEVHHRNGLIIKVPEGFASKETDEGFVVEPEGDKNRQLRRPVAVYISLVKGKSVPTGTSLQTKTLAGKQVRYQTEKSEGGSGGETYSLEAFELVPGGYIEYSQAIQAERGEPDFAMCWSIIESAKIDTAVKN